MCGLLVMNHRCFYMANILFGTANYFSKTSTVRRYNKDNKIHWDEQGSDASLLNVAGLIMNKSFETKQKLAHLPPSLPPLVLGPITGSISLFHTQVGTSLPANGDISRRWEKQLLSKFPRMVSGTHPPLFYNALHLHKVLLWDKWGLWRQWPLKKIPPWASSHSHGSIH